MELLIEANGPDKEEGKYGEESVGFEQEIQRSTKIKIPEGQTCMH